MYQFFNLENLKQFILNTGIFSLQLSFLITSIICLKIYKYKNELILRDILDKDVASDNFMIILYILTGLFPLYFFFIIYMHNITLGLLNSIILFIFTYKLIKLPMSDIKRIYFSKRLLNIKFKKKFHNLFFRPYIYFIISFSTLFILFILEQI